MIKILAVTSNPEQRELLRLDREIDTIQTRLTQYGSAAFEFNIALGVQADTLVTRLRTYKPDILHFAGHGMAGGLIFETSKAGVVVLKSETLSRFLKYLHLNVKCLFLNACYSAADTPALEDSVDCIIGMDDKIRDDLAAEFSANFYEALATGANVKDAFDIAQELLAISDSKSASIPKLFAKRRNPLDIRFASTPQIVAQFICKEGPPACEDNHFKIRIWIQDVPFDIVSVTYKLHSTFKKQFEEIQQGDEDNDDRLYSMERWSFGDFTIRAMLWKWDVGVTGISSRLSDALRRGHGTNRSEEIERAIATISEH